MAGVHNGNSPPKNVMVVADPTRESAAALEYALRHAIADHDTLILCHVENPNNNAWKNPFNSIFNRSSSGSNNRTGGVPNFSLKGGLGSPEIDYMKAMQQASENAQPKVKVVVENVELNGKDKGSVILARSMVHEIDTLVIGQRRTLSSAILGARRSGSVKGLDTAEFLIENCKCTCVGVQKKGQMGGYVLNSKIHKNFWLLA